MQPLEGITVLDLTSVVSGPLATQIMAQQGACIWKVEPREGDRVRYLGAIAKPGYSSVYAVLNAGKSSISLDLAREDGRAVLKRLVPKADVLIHNFRPGVMHRLGLDGATLKGLREDLIVAQISGFGQDGPYSQTRAYDPIVQAESGMITWHGDEPELAPQWICDKTAGLYAVQAITAALFARARTGQGAQIDISMLEAAVAYGWIDLHGNQVFPDTSSRMPDIAAVYRPWKTADGWIVVVMLSQQEFEGWAKAIKAPELITDPRYEDMTKRFLNWDDLRATCAPKIAALSTKDAVRHLVDAGVPCGVVNRSEALLDHPQLGFDPFLEVADLPTSGRIRRPHAVARFNGERSGPGTHAPNIGQDTCKILKAADFSTDDITHVIGSGAAFTPGEE